jgi:hypothetical protein
LGKLDTVVDDEVNDAGDVAVVMMSSTSAVGSSCVVSFGRRATAANG